MIVASFVDETIPDWQMPDVGHHAVTVEAGIVYSPAIGRSEFTRSCGRLAKRRQDRLHHLRTRPSVGSKPGTGPLYSIDSNAIATARAAINSRSGESYLDDFIYDTEENATFEIGHVIARARRSGLQVNPPHAHQAVSVIPGKSFKTDELRCAYEGGKTRTEWTPTVRLSVKIAFEGPRAAVEIAVADLKSAMLFHGPVTRFTELAYAPSPLPSMHAVPSLVAL